MKFKHLIFSFLFFLLFAYQLRADDTAKLEDIFGLQMTVIAPFPDTVPDDVQMDTVRFRHKIKILINYENRTREAQNDFQITAFFPNRTKSYTKFEEADHQPTTIDLDSIQFASWHLGTLQPEQKGSIFFVLKPFVPAHEDTIYLSYGLAAQAFGTMVSEKSHTNIYMPGDSTCPDLVIDKLAQQDSVFSGEQIEYTINYMNQISTDVPIVKPVIHDTLPSFFSFNHSNYPADATFSQIKLDDGRTLLEWKLNNPLYYPTVGSLSYFVTADTLCSQNIIVCNRAEITSDTDEYNYANNRASACVIVSLKIELVLIPQVSQIFNLNNPDSKTFTLQCQNQSTIPIPKAYLKVKVDDQVSGSDIYTVTPQDNGVVDDHVITWELTNFELLQMKELSFDLNLENINQMADYEIQFKAILDTSVELPDLFHSDANHSNNFDDWVVNVDATPDLEVTIREQNNTTNCLLNDVLNFVITCKNNSSQTIGNNQLIVSLDDQFSNLNIYSVTANDGIINSDQNNITWQFGPLLQNDETNFAFQLTFDQLTNYGNFEVNISAETDFPIVSDDNPDNNSAFYLLQVDASPELTIDIQEINNKYIAEPDESLEFKITSTNRSVAINENIEVEIQIIGEKIYTLSNVDGLIIEGDITRIKWNLTALNANAQIDRFFNLTFDKISQPQNQELKLVATIKLSNYEEDWAMDEEQKTISTNVNVDLGIDGLTRNNAHPKLASEVEYLIQISNHGNFPAKNAKLSVEKPDYSKLLYYSVAANRFNISDSSAASYQIALGEVEVDEQIQVVVGLRIFSYKELPDNIVDRFTLTFTANLTYENGPEIIRENSVLILFDPSVSNLFFDKNIVETSQLPLSITFESSGNGNLDLKVFNLAGEFIKQIFSGNVEKGDVYNFQWNADNENNSPVSSGIYFIHANSKFYRDYKKVIIVR